ncbi:MAG: DHH family phosphoesterase [Candidatus Aenigmarchaeota archaeon]|nr:DHH family phosphoesterase [Candidatus Aenigmarchaeota archaeon]
MKKLKRNLNELYSRTREFVGNLKEDDRILLIHHRDMDGIISAVLFQKFLEKDGISPTEIVSWANEDAEDKVEDIKNFDKAVVLDIDISYLWRRLNELDKEILLIDHHSPVKDMNNKKIVYMNPRLVDENIYKPTSYLVWKISEDNERKWLAIVGTISDAGFDDCKDLLKGEIKAKSKDDIWKNKYAKIGFRINAALTQIGFDRVRNILLGIGSFEELEKNEEINECWKKYLEEYNEVKKRFWKNLEEYKKIKLMISKVGKVDRPLTSSLATELSFKHKTKIVVILRDQGDYYAVNTRFQGDGVHLGKLLRKISKGLDGGGGHDHAAGATIRKKDIGIFLNRLIRELETIFKVKKAK